MLRHEEESALMAQTLSQMKQMMMDNETGFGLEKKFGCVKIATLRSTPCTVSNFANLYLALDAILNAPRLEALWLRAGDRFQRQ
jgi:hypothetical protein